MRWRGKNADMATTFGSSGSSARGMADKRRSNIDILVIILLVAGLIFFLLLGSKLGFVGLIVLVFVFKFATDVIGYEIKGHRKRERHALRGAKGEDRVAEIIHDFPDGYHVHHNVNTGTGDIDHVLISPEGGVFVIETKAHGGKVTFENGEMILNGKKPEKNFIGQALRNAYLVRDEIKRQTGKVVWVNTALVFSNAFVDQHGPIKGVHVMNRRFLGAFIDRNKPRRIDTELAGSLSF